MLTEYEIKKFMNAKSSGNPYHDELGRFTTGPTAAFSSMGYRADSDSKYDSHIAVEPSVLQASRKLMNEQQGFYTTMNDKQIKAIGLYSNGFEQMEKSFKNASSSGERYEQAAKTIEKEARNFKNIVENFGKSTKTKKQCKQYFSNVINADVNMDTLKRRKQIMESSLKSSTTNPTKIFYKKASTAYSLMMSSYNTMKYISENLNSDSQARLFERQEILDHVKKYGE